MVLPKFEYVAPKTVAEACRFLAKHKGAALPLAGGTDVLVAMKQRVIKPAYLVDIKGLDGLRDIKKADGGGLSIGALVKLLDLQESELIAKHSPVVAQAAAKVAALPQQAMGTIGGNVCLDTRCWFYNQSAEWRRGRAPCVKFGGEACSVAVGAEECYAAYSGDLAPALIVLGAKARLAKPRGQKLIPLEELYSGDGAKPIALKPGELITHIEIPRPAPNSAASYMKLRLREAIDFPLVGVAVMMAFEKGGRKCTDAKVAMTAVGMGPVISKNAAAALLGKNLDEATIEAAADEAVKDARPVKCMVSTPSYRKKMAGVMLTRAVREIASSLGISA